MSMFDRIKDWLTQRSSRKSPLQRNMEKALQMKQAAGPQTSIPEDRTSHTGGVHGGQTDYTDAALKVEGTHIENMGRSHGVRRTDKGKTT